MPKSTKEFGHPPPVPKQLVLPLLTWFAANARDLPWRRTRDPYAIWVSEIMLQQTQVKTVIPYWERWMRKLPDVAALASAQSGTIHKLWEGLGYYTRVRNMQKAAQIILSEHGGRFPKTFEAILALPGIGRYTAGAIASIAFNLPAPILDGNVIRVLTRLHGIGEDPREKRTNEQLWSLAEQLVTHAKDAVIATAKTGGVWRQLRADRACSFLNQSLMELGALICTPRNPDCGNCPLARYCTALREDRIADLPRPKDRPTVTERRFVALVLRRNGRFLVRQRRAGLVNAHLWEFPNWEVPTKNSTLRFVEEQFRLKPSNLSKLSTIKHSITRYRVTTEAYQAELTSQSRHAVEPGSVWRSIGQLRQLAFTGAHRQIVDALEKMFPNHVR